MSKIDKDTFDLTTDEMINMTIPNFDLDDTYFDDLIEGEDTDKNNDKGVNYDI